ncbi:hypothetical protein SB2_27990 [Methylobacterium radiotolerans]|nr:hypothetical protein SB3_29565 [Methylobacterium radiotolerans]KTS43401.1 hypothetical protein SB2_27990 [Methylobacterium radiotolerans]
MAEPALLPGNRFRAYRGSGSPLVYAFVCLGASITLTITNSYEDATVADCDNPVAIPDRKSILSSRSWGGRIAGSVAADHLDDLRADAASETPIPYQFRVDPKDGVDAGNWAGAVFVESLEIGKSNNGIVSFTCQFRGDGPLVWNTGAGA